MEDKLSAIQNVACFVSGGPCVQAKARYMFQKMLNHTNDCSKKSSLFSVYMCIGAVSTIDTLKQLENVCIVSASSV